MTMTVDTHHTGMMYYIITLCINVLCMVHQIEGTDAVVNLSVMRLDRKLSFDVNTTGVYHAIMAAVEAGKIMMIYHAVPRHRHAMPCHVGLQMSSAGMV
jgi:hypothetical protein